MITNYTYTIKKNVVYNGKLLKGFAFMRTPSYLREYEPVVIDDDLQAIKDIVSYYITKGYLVFSPKGYVMNTKLLSELKEEDFK